ncbi:cell wall-active antibiotics response protein [Micromonospora sp. R77]|uniref:cell wall-active antibiotics response protein n=1 Tax=Micromonospora sp. R77 TaxID=2925836 RepID=UPI001F60A5AD|nr:cell wall-active antibiotics response protein [Micromonospora sp. R77]MCI4061114.1 cell wall-active antibiotics response protein [Micromonospora sp. R77]
MAVSGDDAGRRPAGPEPTTAAPAPVVEVSGDPDAAAGRAGAPGGTGVAGAGPVLAAAAVLVVVLGVVAVVVTMSHPERLGFAFSGGGRPPAPATGAESGGVGAAEAAADQVLAAPLAGRRRATFELVDGLTTFGLRTADLGEDLYRISTPPDGSVSPRAELSGDRVRLRVQERGRRGTAAVEVLLNSRVTWRLRIVGGVDVQLLDLTSARVAGVELVGGATRTELRLPRPAGTLTVRMTGGVNQFVIRVPDEVPVRVRVASGAGSVAVGADRRDGVAAGELLGSPGWDRAVRRLYVDLVAGANTVTVGGD